MFDEQAIERVIAACARWGFPADLSQPGAAWQAYEAVQRVDGEMDALYPEQRSLLAALQAQDSGTPEGDAKMAAFVFGLMMQAAALVSSDASRAGRDQ